MPKISAYPVGTPILASDQFVVARGGANDKILGSELLPQQGTLHNGKLSVTVAGNNLTVALKTLAGGNPSASDPVLVCIGSSWRAITAALSVTKNAGTNWFDSGSSMLATKEIDYFVYLGYNATDGITIGFARWPSVNRYDGFSTTTTDQLYCAISTIAHAAAADPYIVIGRFAATLSAGAGYTWSVPSFTDNNLIQRPIFDTRLLSYTPSVTAQGGVPTSWTFTTSTYIIKGTLKIVYLDMTVTNKGTATGLVQISLPLAYSGLSTGGGQDVITGKAVSFYVGGAGLVYIALYDGTTEWVNNNRPVVTVVYVSG